MCWHYNKQELQLFKSSDSPPPSWALNQPEASLFRGVRAYVLTLQVNHWANILLRLVIFMDDTVCGGYLSPWGDSELPLGLFQPLMQTKQKSWSLNISDWIQPTNTSWTNTSAQNRFWTLNLKTLARVIMSLCY